MKSFCKQKDVTKPKLQSQLSSADLFGDDEELSSDEEQVRFRQMHAENVVIYLSLFIATKSVKSKDLALQNFQCMTAPPSPALNSIFHPPKKYLCYKNVFSYYKLPFIYGWTHCGFRNMYGQRL